MGKRLILPLMVATLHAADPIPSGMNQFAAAAYGKLARGGGNIISSPFNISIGLSMAMAGARGRTATEMQAVLHQTGTDAGYHASLAALIGQVTNTSNVGGDELAMANGLWVEQGFPVLPGFEQIIRTQYGAPLTPVDFAHHAEAARTRINSWTSEHTKGKIQELFGHGSLAARTRLVITSAIYFYGKWALPFPQKMTANAPFKLAGGGTADARFMRQAANFGYAETDSLQILEMKYADQVLAFDVLLPKAVDGLGDLEKSLSAANLDSWLASLSGRRVEVALPKFRAESQFALGPSLASLGMPSAFQASADFSGMDGRHDLCVSQVIHKAFVDVSEEGTEAAAATGLVMRPMAARVDPGVIFHADHPFVFLIRDTRSGVILFAGRLTNPK
jgi:serpin B